MNSLKQHLFSFSVLRSPFSVLRSPFSVIRVPALSPGVMAVEAAPDFHHEEARVGCPAAVRAPRCPVAPGHRAISLKVILLSAVLAIAGIGGAHAAPQQCDKYGYEPTGDWVYIGAIPKRKQVHLGPGSVKSGVSGMQLCVYKRSVQVWFNCCDEKFYSLPGTEYGKHKNFDTVPIVQVRFETDLPGSNVGVEAFNAVTSLLDSSLGFDIATVITHEYAEETKRLCELEEPQGKTTLAPLDAPYLDCDGPEKTRKLTQKVATKNWWERIFRGKYTYPELKPKEVTEDDPAKRDDYEKLKPEETTKDDPAKDR